jgi:hypothetical protein
VNADERRRIEALIQTATEALDEPAPPESSIEQVALRRLNRLSRRGQRAVIAMLATEDSEYPARSARLAHDVEDVVHDDIGVDVHQDQVSVHDAVLKATGKSRQDFQHGSRHG